MTEGHDPSVEILRKSKVLVTGGTGSFGSQITSELLKLPVNEVRIFSRGEDLQHQMALKFTDKRLRFVLGDVRDYQRVSEAMTGIDYVFHAAALKQVPDCEFHPLEAVKTNVIGAHNVKIAAIQNRVKKVVAISTDKAVKPVNAMGMTKALQEKILLSSELNEADKTIFCVVRYGNVIGSRGSVVRVFRERLEKGQDLEVTDTRMTRFWLTLQDAVRLVFKALQDSRGGEIYIMKRPSCLVIDLAKTMAGTKVGVIETKVRPGEKIHETLVQEDEMRRAEESDEYYVIHPVGSTDIPHRRAGLTEYTSENTRRLTKVEIAEMLKSAGFL